MPKYCPTVEIDIPACRARGYTLIAHGDQPVTSGRCLPHQGAQTRTGRLSDACLIPHQSPTTGPGELMTLVPRGQRGPEEAPVSPPNPLFSGRGKRPNKPSNHPQQGSGPLHDYRDTFEAVLSLFPITRTPPAPHRPPKDTITGTPSDTTVASKLTEAGNGCSPGDYRDTFRYDHPCFS